MRFSSAIVLAVVIVLASSPNSAMPTDMSSDSVSDCPNTCKTEADCYYCAGGDCMADRWLLHSEWCFYFHTGGCWY
ncbi:hypothetical protein BDR07DRAFT_1428023 [Suillus spraguei]|nr:hypothetical protein BDR07DRAFT_1428023 [Suillus spraguei]